MPYIYENDPTKIGTNLQTAVAYLLSLHKNEYEWNLLGIKVVGVKEALPIPDGIYDYGDAYMIGTEADGYEMWIYTRADEAHSEAYWFNVGAFPKPGPQGPKGDGVETFTNISLTHDIYSGDVYGSNEGQTYNGRSTIRYKDSTTGETKSQDIYTTVFLPIVGSDYINIAGDPANSRFVLRLDDTALSQDYVKIDKTVSDVTPVFENGKITWYKATQFPTPQSIAWRNNDGDCSFRVVNMTGFVTPGSNQIIGYWNIWRDIYDEGLEITKTTTDTGILTVADLEQIQAPGYKMVKYEDKLYYRYDPRNAPDGTLNFIHLDSIEDGKGGYKATGKCFSITVSTREWKVVDLDFKGQTTHNLLITDNVSGNGYYFQLATTQSAAYTTADVSTIIAEVKGKIIPCVFRKGTDSDKKFYSGILQATDAGFSCYYGDQNMDFGMTPTQVTVKDNV